jgi:DNA invertase Pin-like site-specific DNA recombinase
LVWKLDRLGRSLKDLVNTLDELGALGIDFVSYENQLDTSTPTGKLVFHVIGAVAEFEKDIIRERVKAGLANARRKGKKLGRPPMSDGLLEKAKALRAEGLSFRKIGKRLGVDEGTVRKKTKRNQQGSARN